MLGKPVTILIATEDVSNFLLMSPNYSYNYMQYIARKYNVESTKLEIPSFHDYGLFKYA